MAGEPREWRAVHVRGEIGAHGIAFLFTHVLLPSLGIKPRHFVYQDRNFIRLEQVRKKQVTVAIQSRALLRFELHCALVV